MTQTPTRKVSGEEVRDNVVFLRVTKGLYQKIKAYAARNNATINACCNNILEQYLTKEPNNAQEEASSG